MLKWRFLTALCLIPLVLWGILRLDEIPFMILTAFILSVGANEWTALCPFSKRYQQFVFVACFIGLLMAIYGLNSSHLLIGAFVFWIVAGIGLCRYKGDVLKWLTNRFVKAAIGLFILAAAWYALVVLRRMEHGPLWLIVCLVLIWATDTFAYFTGRAIGKRPLAPLISPKKTLAGFWGGLVGTLVLAVGLYYGALLPSHHFSVGMWLSITLGTILLAVIGDLFESLMKRLAGVKDSGKLLPGHGGVLDRLDSLFAALPFFVLALSWLEKTA